MTRQMSTLRVACSWRARMRGLLRTRLSSEALLLVPCRSVHTFGMGYAIHIAFLDENGVVLKSVSHVRRGCIVRCRKAVAVLEQASLTVREWPRVGDRVCVMFTQENCYERKSNENVSGLSVAVLR